MTWVPRRRAGDGVQLPVYLAGAHTSVEGADGELVGVGFHAFLDRQRTVELVEDEVGTVLPGVFLTRVGGVDFHDDVLPLANFEAGRWVEIRPEPSNPLDHHALAVIGGGHRVGYVPGVIAGSLAPPGTRSGRAIVVTEWSTNGVRHGISILGSMSVTLEVSIDD